MKKVWLVLVVLILAVLACGGGGESNTYRAGDKSSVDTCVVEHPSGQAQVFTNIENNDNARAVSNGTTCVISARQTWAEAGIEIPLYNVTCGSVRGHINQQFCK